MKVAIIDVTLFFTDDESKKTLRIYLNEYNEIKQIEKFILSFRTIYEFLNQDFQYLLVNYVQIREEIINNKNIDVNELDI